MNIGTKTFAARTHDIAASLRALHIEQVRVEADDQRIYLRGVAPCYEAKQRAGELAERAAPGACIENELRVGGAGFGDDGDMRREVIAALQALSPDIAERVTVKVKGGVVHLLGEALDARQRRAIECASWNAGGVNRVENQLTVRGQQPSDVEVGRALSEYVGRTLNVRAGSVVVEYVAGVACISGHIASASQRQAIEDLIRWHDQVRDVVNNLRTAGPQAPRHGTGVVVHTGVTHHI
jgi:osmotically-inducible protein OsmY